MTDLTDVRWMRLTFVDVFGTGNAVQIPADRFEEVCARGLPFDGSSLEGRARLFESDMLLLPDRQTVTGLGSSLARVVCNAATIDGAPWAGDPRTALQRAVSRFGELSDAYTAGAELEFYLLNPDGRPVDEGGYYDEVEGAGTQVTREAADALRRAGLAIDLCHHEAGPGQYEINLPPAAPLALADALVFAKQTIKETANAAGVRATFMPRPLDDRPGSGLHLQQAAGDLLFDASGTLTETGRQFAAGQIAHAPALSALAAPTVNSYKRLHAGPEAPGAVVWAYSNRAALIRVSSYRGEAASVEYRAADPLANPYLLLAALLATGFDGIEHALELGPPAEEDAGGYDPASALAVRYRPLPRDLDSALDALLADDVVLDAFDGQLIARLVDGRRVEAESFRAHVTGWEIEAYRDLG